MTGFDRLEGASSRVGLTAVYLAALYAVLGLALLAASPTVGSVLLIVAGATLLVFLLLERVTRRRGGSARAVGLRLTRGRSA